MLAARRAAAMWVVGVSMLVGACGDAPEPTDYAAVSWPAGDAVEVADLRGAPVLLAGWATWCVPCERELPELDEFATTPAAEGLRIVAVNVDGSGVGDDDLAEMLDRLDVDLPVWRDPRQALLRTFEGSMMPFSVLLDDDGAVRRTWIGSLDTDGDEFLDAVADVTD